MNDLNKMDKKLIEQQEKYEDAYYDQLVDEMLREEALDKLIAERFEYIDDSFDFEPSPGYQQLDEFYHSHYDNKFQNESRGIEGNDDYIDYIDYPDGPDENLNGVNYEEHYHEMEMEYEKFPPEFYDQFVEDALHEYQNDDDELEFFIKKHINEEKEFLNHMLEEIIIEENYFKKAIDELIFEEIDLNYEPALFNYEEDIIIIKKDEDKQKVHSVFKNYVTKDDKLDNVVKQKLKEKKF